jgi:hypothetical protein
VTVDRRREEFADDFEPAAEPGLDNGYRRAWRLTHLAQRPWPSPPASQRCDTNGRLILQHRVTGRVRVLGVTCRTWGCPACGGRRAKEILDKLDARWKPDSEIWWATGQDQAERDRHRAQLLGQLSRSHAWIRRKGTFHVFADTPLDRGRRLSPPEALLVARFGLRPGVVRVWGPWVTGRLDALYRRLDFASAQAAQAARQRAEAAILATHGLAYSFDEDDPPPGLENEIAATFLAALEVGRDLCATTALDATDDGW